MASVFTLEMLTEHSEGFCTSAIFLALVYIVYDIHLQVDCLLKE